MQFTPGKYINLPAFFSYMNEHYPQAEGTWGGSIGIGRSPINCQVIKEDVSRALNLFYIPSLPLLR
jgi:hypothetical protein